MVTMSATWDRATEFLSDNPGPVAAIAGLTLFLPNVAEGIVGPLQAAAEPGGRLGLSIVSLVLSLIGVFGQTALIALALDPTLGRDGAFRTAARRFGPMIAVSVAVLAIVIALCLPPLFLVALDGIDLAAMQEGAVPNLSPGNALLITLYLLILLPFLFWLLARLLPLGGVVVAERRGLGAIRHAFALSRGLTMKLIGVVILFCVVAGVAILATKTVIGSIARLLIDGRGTLDAPTVITAIAAALVSAIFTTLATAFVAKLYIACAGRAGAAPTA
jgi:hypothetical protein